MTAFPKPVKKPKVRKPLRQRSRKMTCLMASYVPIRNAFLKQNPGCLCCFKRGLRVKLATDVHHSRGRLNALLCHVPFFVPVCRGCHRWIEENMDEARKLGLLCRKGDWGKQPNESRWLP